MPLYEYRCETCGKNMETIQPLGASVFECCDRPMLKVPGNVMIRIKGEGLPSRKKWFDNWKPGTPNLSIGSHHGERY